MAKTQNLQTQVWRLCRPALVIWLVSAFIFFVAFNMILQNYYKHLQSSLSANERRLRLYDKIERDLDERGALFLKYGETSQSLSLSDLFMFKDGAATPILKVADPPVRANVLYLNISYSVPISDAVRRIFYPYFDKVIWFQNSSMYHFSMFHASHHIAPIHATMDEVEAEANAVKSVAEVLCPLRIVLERVVLTSTGVLLGCWQVVAGTDPKTIRSKLRTSLPRAPEMQLYDADILHTSFARLLGHPKIPPAELHKASNLVQFFHELVRRLNVAIRGFEAEVSELWYVEEYDVLALALNGKMKIRNFHFGCP